MIALSGSAGTLIIALCVLGLVFVVAWGRVEAQRDAVSRQRQRRYMEEVRRHVREDPDDR